MERRPPGRVPIPDQGFLRDGCELNAVRPIESAEDQRASRIGHGAHGGVEQPIVEANRMMKPDGVVETRAHEGLAGNSAGPEERRRHQRPVGRIHEDGRVQVRVVRNHATRSNPDCAHGIARSFVRDFAGIEDPDLDRIVEDLGRLFAGRTGAQF